MGRLFEMFRGAGAVTDDVDLRFGTYEDRSVYRNAISATGAPQWIATQFGWGLNFAGSQRLSRGTTTTPSAVLVVGAIPNMCDQDSRTIQFDGSGLSLAIINQSSLLTVATGATARANLGLRSSLAYIVNFEPLEVYAENGKTTAAALAGAPATSTMVVGNINAGVTPIQSYINKISTFNITFSQTQAQDLLAELLSERFPTKAYSFQKQSQTKQIGSPVLHWDLRERDATGQFPDLSGNGRSTTTARSVDTGGLQLVSPVGTTSTITRIGGTTEVLNGNENHAISFWFSVPNVAGSPILVRNVPITFRVHMYAATRLAFFYSTSANDITYPFANNAKYHFAYNKGTNSCYINGKKVTVTGTPGITPTGDLVLGYSAQATMVKYGSLRVFATGQDNNARELYLEGSRVDFDLNLAYAPVTLANVSTVNDELADNLRVASGTWLIPTDKTATSVAAGTLWARMQAFGSLRTTVQTPGDLMQIGFASVRGAPNVTAQNGYWAKIDGGTFRITKSAAGTETTLASGGVATAGVAYDVQLDWETDGTLTLSTRRKGAGPFEVACSVVDTAIVTSEYVCMYASAAGCKFGPRISHNEIALTPQEWGG